MTAHLATQIEIDDKGTARIAGTGMKVKNIVLDKMAYNWSPEEIQDQYPRLTLAQIYAAIAYYYENQADMDALIQKEREQVNAMAAEAANSPLQRRLRSLRDKTVS